MFVPVACLRCGKLFQVPPAAAGTDVTCPWCRDTTPALPVATVPPAPTRAPEPLSLDDAEPIPPPPPPPLAAVPALPPRKPVKPLFILAVLAGVVLVAAATAAALGYRSGRVGVTGWATFTPPDGAFTATFLDTPTATPVEPNPLSVVTRGGEEYSASGWYSGGRTWVGWQTLDPEQAKPLADDKDTAFAAAVIDAERDRRVKAAGGTVAKQGDFKSTYGRGQVVQTDTPRGKRVEYYIVAAAGPRPRLYVVGIEAPKLDPAGPLPQKVLTGFRLAPP